MSKKLVQDALGNAAAGDWRRVDEALAKVDRQFLVRQLAHLLRQRHPPLGAAALAQHVGFRGPTAEALVHELPRATPTAPAKVARAAVELTDGLERIVLDDPGPFLAAVSVPDRFTVDLERLRVAEVWGLVGIAALCRKNGASAGDVRLTDGGKTSSFAYAVGLVDVIENRPPRPAHEPDRTVRLRRVRRFDEIEAVSEEVSRLIVSKPRDEATRRTIYYVLVELLRNVVQHSRDPLGGVVAAQLNRRRSRVEAVQVAVCDCGIGIPASLEGMHPKLVDPREALEKALHPSISGTFEEGLSGSRENAGMGLFFISEIAKLTGGKLLVASRGAALVVEGDSARASRQLIRFVDTGVGFPGTLVAFELALGRVPDHDALLERIRSTARDRVPRRAVHRWLVFVQAAPPGVLVYDAAEKAEDTAAAQRLAGKLARRLTSRLPVGLDFRGLAIGTQSYLHALLFEPLRLAWALRIPIYVLNAEPAVRSGLELLESYALGG